LGTITVSLTTIPTFAGISLVGNSGVDSVTIGSGGINLAAITKGAADQGFSVNTMAGVTDRVRILNPIVTKGAGSVAITTLGVGSTQGIRLKASVTSAGASSQSYSGAVTLQANPMLSSGTGGIVFSSTLDGASSISLSTTGPISLSGNVGSTTPLKGMTVSKAASMAVQAGLILSGTGTSTGANGLTIAAGVNNVVFAPTEAVRTISKFATGSGIALLGGSTASTVQGITIIGNFIGLSVAAGTYTGTLVTGCTLSGNSRIGISLTNARSIAIGNTKAGGNTIATNLWGIYAIGTLTGTTIRNNRITDVSRFGIYLNNAAGVKVGGALTNQGNSITNS